MATTAAKFFVAILGIFADLSDSFNPAIGDLVVSRRDNGDIVLRRDGAGADTVALVRRELEQLTVADFLEQWKHYEPWLGPLKDALGEALTGYRD